MITKYTKSAPKGKDWCNANYGVTVPARELFPCSHEWKIYRRIKSNSAVFYQSFCIVCHEPGITHKTKELSQEQIINADCLSNQDEYSEFCKPFYELQKKRQELYFKNQNEESGKLGRDWSVWYQEYLQSEVWRNKALKVLTRALFMCEACLENKATQVHHLTYDNVGKEPLFDLVAICDECHEEIHKKQHHEDRQL